MKLNLAALLLVFFSWTWIEATSSCIETPPHLCHHFKEHCVLIGNKCRHVGQRDLIRKEFFSCSRIPLNLCNFHKRCVKIEEECVTKE